MLAKAQNTTVKLIGRHSAKDFKITREASEKGNPQIVYTLGPNRENRVTLPVVRGYFR